MDPKCNASAPQSPPEIAAHGPDAIRTWEESMVGDEPLVNEAKLVFLGDGGVGKTSLSMRLRNESFSGDEAITQGIEISTIRGRVNGQGFSLNLWDFGGQEVLHSTHQLFLPRRGIYVIVLDSRRETDPESWLQLVATRGKESPVLIVINKIDENPALVLNERYFRTKYKNISGVYRVSCLTGQGIAALRESLWDIVSDSVSFGVTWPASWFRIRATLERSNRDFLDHDDFVDLCSREGLADSRQQDALLGFFHDLGVVAYFPHVALQVLNPGWVTSAIYRIMSAPAIIQAGGVLNPQLLKGILGSSPTERRAYPANERRAILAIMQQFEMCYEQPDRTILVPNLLPNSEPECAFDTNIAARVRFQYAFLPPAVFHRLLVRLHRDIDGTLRWRHGAVLQRGPSARALIRVAPRASAVDVWLLGDERWQLFETIRNHIASINQDFDDLTADEIITCRCEPCRAAERPYFYYVRALFARLENGVRTVVCERSDARLDLGSLLPGHPLLSVLDTPSSSPVFISYSTADRNLVLRVVADMRAAGIAYWLDQERIRPGDSVSDALNRALTDCQTLVACVSENQRASGWARAEYGMALASFLSGGSKRVIPLILGNASLDVVPAILRDLKAVQYTDPDDYRTLLEDLATPPVRGSGVEGVPRRPSPRSR